MSGEKPEPPPPQPQSAASEACRAFLDSMQVGYERWRDGAGYDLAALARLTGDERRHVAELLLQRIRSSAAGWRDVEAIDALDLPDSRAILEQALSSPSREVRLHVARILTARAVPAEIDKVIADVLRGGGYEDGLSLALDLAASCATPYLRNVLLDCARAGHPNVRVHAAALCLYLAGKADEPFDWKHRPFLLRFGEEDGPTRERAFAELCRRIGAAGGRWPEPSA